MQNCIRKHAAKDGVEYKFRGVSTKTVQCISISILNTINY